MIKWHHADPNNRMYCNIEGGKKIAMPRYFKQKLYDDEQRIEIGHNTRKRMLLDAERQEQLGNTVSFRDKEQAILAALRNFKTQINDKL